MTHPHQAIRSAPPGHSLRLTERQAAALAFIRAFATERGYEPTYQQIADGLRLRSLATVSKHICALAEKGYLAKGALGYQLTAKPNPGRDELASARLIAVAHGMSADERLDDWLRRRLA